MFNWLRIHVPDECVDNGFYSHLATENRNHREKIFLMGEWYNIRNPAIVKYTLISHLLVIILGIATFLM